MRRPVVGLSLFHHFTPAPGFSRKSLIPWELALAAAQEYDSEGVTGWLFARWVILRATRNGSILVTICQRDLFIG
jgi:hypothetical protein